VAAKGAPQLRIVTEHGEVVEEPCPNCAGAEKEVRAWRMRYANLKREVDNELEGHELFPEAKRLFDFWRERCKHPRSKFTAERFEQCLPHLRDLGADLCKRAIEGIAYDPYITRRKNGSVERHDAWSLLFRNREKVEEFANRAPYHLPDPQKVATLARALEWVHPEWPTEKAVHEAQERLR
jgi:hypothetical protein